MLSQPQYALGFYKPEGIVELTWLPGTEQMDCLLYTSDAADE